QFYVLFSVNLKQYKNRTLKAISTKPGMLARAYNNSSTGDVEAEESGVQGQPQLQESLLQNRSTKASKTSYSTTASISWYPSAGLQTFPHFILLHSYISTVKPYRRFWKFSLGHKTRSRSV
ncbi:mCG145844, partial [Mus musculus]